MAKPVLSIVIIVLSALAAWGCGGRPSLASRLPANHEIDNWTLSASPTIADSDVALYNQIDGAAPKYIDRGWVGSVYANYEQVGSSLRVAIAIHDMGTPEDAQALFQYELPVSRVQISNLPGAVVDTGLPADYAAYAVVGQYYIEVSIDDRSDSALDYVQRFVVATMNRC
jgi:hypothetical protein